MEALQPSNLHGNYEEVVEPDGLINIIRMLVNGVLEAPPWVFLQGLHVGRPHEGFPYEDLYLNCYEVVRMDRF